MQSLPLPDRVPHSITLHRPLLIVLKFITSIKVFTGQSLRLRVRRLHLTEEQEEGGIKRWKG